MTTNARTERAPGRRAGYVVAALLNAAMLYAVHAWPGWEALPFLTEETPQVLGLVTASIVAGLLANIVYLVSDPAWLRTLGDLVTTSIGLAALIVIWQVFPFDFTAYSFDWELVARVLLVVGIVGSAIGILVAAGKLVRLSVTQDLRHGPRLRH